MDFFGYQRTGNARAQIVSSEFARISIGGQVSLVQSFQAAYQHDVRPVFEIGSPQIRWVTGHPRGTINVGRIVGNNGFFAAFGGGGNCGHLATISINASRGQECADVNVSSGGSARFSGAILQGVGLTLTAGQVQIMETAQILFTDMEIS